jgi:hypothetical protein
MAREPIDDARDRAPDLLSRPPVAAGRPASEWSDFMIDPVRQLEALADLFTMGLLSQEEYERFKSQIGGR